MPKCQSFRLNIVSRIEKVYALHVAFIIHTCIPYHNTLGQIYANVNQKIFRLEIVFDRLWYAPVYPTARRHRSEAHRSTFWPPDR